jgi:hypothetical protein
LGKEQIVGEGAFELVTKLMRKFSFAVHFTIEPKTFVTVSFSCIFIFWP